MKRRDFIQRLVALSGTSTLLGAGTSLAMMEKAFAASSTQFNDHKSLVCVFLHGGNDCSNMIVPTDNAGYADYQTHRSGIAIGQQSLHALNGTEYGFHPAMGNLAARFNSGQLAVVNSVGALVEPATKTQIQNHQVALPASLFAHNHQQHFWHTLGPIEVTGDATGWGGRMADLFASSQPTVPASLLVADGAPWLNGQSTSPYATGLDGINRLNYQHANNDRRAALQRLLSSGDQSVMGRQLQHSINQTVGTTDQLATAFSQSAQPGFQASNDFERKLRTAAQGILARQQLGAKRQLFMITLGGFDTHGNQLEAQNGLLSLLNGGLEKFQAEMDAQGLADSVTLFTASDFGRTMTVNGNGTDHAWASQCLVMGGAVNGGQFHGTMHDTTPGGSADATKSGTGRFIPNYSVDQYAATLAQWMGLSASECLDVFPHLVNFNEKNLAFI
ncbi:hypothetical protein CHH28_10765 [Bacterioplanes sanyensis]|uniref:Tat pathway signal protein n=1 Tax=Bacterioplanes sanyensis TaxID=1249553 RepID=A0A222FKE9_9GAMM|nr:DUF1501 domain-containing protein [Bacterioplanes sanyensis]ASP39132.1 hypothetical protein CHH28_10765 [Bacterioplanes sanyensis]